MGPYLFQQEILSGEECRKTLGLWDENIPKEAHIFKGPLHHKEGNILERVVMVIILIGDHIEIEDPLKERDIQAKVEGCQIKENILIEMEGLPEEEDILEEDPLVMEDPLMEMEDSLMMEDPLMEMEDPQEMEDPLVDKDHQALKDPLGWLDLS